MLKLHVWQKKLYQVCLEHVEVIYVNVAPLAHCRKTSSTTAAESLEAELACSPPAAGRCAQQA